MDFQWPVLSRLRSQSKTLSWCCKIQVPLHKKWSFPLRISSVNFFRKLRIWSHLLKKSLTENFIFCAMYSAMFYAVSLFPITWSFFSLAKFLIIHEKLRKAKTLMLLCLFRSVDHNSLWSSNKLNLTNFLRLNKQLIFTSSLLF